MSQRWRIHTAERPTTNRMRPTPGGKVGLQPSAEAALRAARAGVSPTGRGGKRRAPGRGGLPSERVARKAIDRPGEEGTAGGYGRWLRRLLYEGSSVCSLVLTSLPCVGIRVTTHRFKTQSGGRSPKSWPWSGLFR